MKSIPVSLIAVVVAMTAGVGAAPTASSKGGNGARQAIQPFDSSSKNVADFLERLAPVAVQPLELILPLARNIPGWILYFLLDYFLPFLDKVAITMQYLKPLPVDLREIAAFYESFYNLLRNLGYVS